MDFSKKQLFGQIPCHPMVVSLFPKAVFISGNLSAVADSWFSGPQEK
jgi:hypothetical protein